MHKLVLYPDVRLRSPSITIVKIDNKVRRIAAEMADVLIAADGAGLAAIQIGEPIRMFAVDAEIATGKPGVPVFFINPMMIDASDEMELADEGCLSLPGKTKTVARTVSVRMRALGLDGVEFIVDASGTYARVLQHEYDHLNGKLYIDR